MPIAIRVNKLGKSYLRSARTYSTLHETIKSRILGSSAKSEERFWAIKDVSFDIEQGEFFVLAGPNGSGKSTLLRILAQITKPCEGEFHVSGRVAALLEVGCGFHLELSGRENIWLSGSIMGMKRAAIRRHFDEIVDFSGIEGFIDSPVKTYSSGMFLRLGFAVAAHLERDVLLIDETLALGDQAFQMKCLSKLNELMKAGKTVLLASHEIEMVSRWANRGLCLDKGRVIVLGMVREIASHYEASCFRVEKKLSGPAGMSSALASIGNIFLKDANGQVTSVFRPSDSIVVEALFSTIIPMDLSLEFRLETVHGILLALATSSDYSVGRIIAGEYHARCTFPAGLLNRGSFRLKIVLDSADDVLSGPESSTIEFRVDAPVSPGQYLEPALSVRPDFVLTQRSSESPNITLASHLESSLHSPAQENS